MHGNLSEWCFDRHWHYPVVRKAYATQITRYYRGNGPKLRRWTLGYREGEVIFGPRGEVMDPDGPANEHVREFVPSRAVRGGAWNENGGLFLRSARPAGSAPHDRFNSYGFRLSLRSPNPWPADEAE